MRHDRRPPSRRLVNQINGALAHLGYYVCVAPGPRWIALPIQGNSNQAHEIMLIVSGGSVLVAHCQTNAVLQETINQQLGQRRRKQAIAIPALIKTIRKHERT
jgi:hypothetical protein